MAMENSSSPAQPKPRYQGIGRTMQRDLVAKWYGDLTGAEERNEPVAYLFVMGSLGELLMTLGFHAVYPEINAVQAGAKKVSLENIVRAEDLGYSADVCGYVKNDIGMTVNDFQHPMGKIPRPSLLLCNFSGCATYVKWFEQLQTLLGARLVMLDIPCARPVGAHDVKYVTRQLEELIAVCEEIGGRKFDIDRLREIEERSNEAIDGWVKVLHAARNVPSPYDAFSEGVAFMAPINVLRGTPECAEYYRALNQELQERIALGITPLPQERFRVVLDGTPCWPALRTFSALFQRWGAIFVSATYTKVGGIFDFGFRFDTSRPLETLAEFCLYHQFGNLNLQGRYDLLERYYDDYQADGFVFHAVKSCRLFSMGMGDTREFFLRRRNIPTLLVESDLVDPRYFSEAQLRNRIDAFFEALEQRKYYQAPVTA